MNAQDAATLCRAAKAICPQQKFDPMTPDFWHPLLADIGFEDAKRALIEVAKRQPFVSPAEIRAQVAISRKRMVAEIPPVDPPWQLADLPADEQRWIASYRHAIADGLPTEVARTRANYLAGITDDPEPLVIEAAAADKLRAAIAASGEAMRLRQMDRTRAIEERRAAEVAHRDQQRAAIDKANAESLAQVTAAKEAAEEREVASVDDVLARHVSTTEENV